MKNPIFVVLAGGIGKNFSPLVTSKSIFPFLGKPLIQHVLEMIQFAGARETIVVCNGDNQEIIQNLSGRNLKINTILQNQATGQADAIKLVSKMIEPNQPIIIMNGVDIIDPTQLRNFVKKASQTYAQVLGMRVSEHFLGGYLQVQGERVISIVEKPAKGEEPSDIVNLFFHYFSNAKEIFELISQQKGGDDAYERALDKLIQDKPVNFVTYDGYFAKLKQAHHVLDMTQLFLRHKIKNKIDRTAKIDKMAKIEGPVQIEAGARILAGAVIKGPAYIGKNVIVGNHSLIRDSIVESDSIIGFGSEVARSYVGPNCSLHHNFIGDSVLEAEVNPSYGTCTANLRFDGNKVKMRLASKKGEKDQLIETNKEKLGTIMAKGVFLGVNCSILPGITLAAKATAYPGSVIDRSLTVGEMFPKK